MNKKLKRCACSTDHGATCLPNLDGGDCVQLEVLEDDQLSKKRFSGASYKGCYKVLINHSDIEFKYESFMTPKGCIQSCQTVGYKYAIIAGMEYGCICQQNINESAKLSEERCVKACSVDPIYSCGKMASGHVFDTGLIKVNSCEKSNACPNGTTCLPTYDTHICVCNESSPNKPVGCYGCLGNWMTTPHFEQCYMFSGFNENSTYIDTYCKSIYGEAVHVQTSDITVFFARIFMEFMKKSASEMVAREPLEFARYFGDGEDKEYVDMQFPICQRIKTPVIGKFPWVTWPKGSYGLPRPKSGCPKGNYFHWEIGSYYEDTENDNNSNHRSNESNLAGNVSKDGVFQGYCIKLSQERSQSWPKGRYCIYRKGDCPPNMKPGSIFWDDEDTNNTNHGEGILPDGMFKKDTLVKFCCNTDSLVQEGIILPRDRPFYLFPYGSRTCQPVIGTEVRLEMIQWDIEDYYGDLGAFVAFQGAYPQAEVTNVGKHLQVYYCFYNPVKCCGPPAYWEHINHSSAVSFKVGSVLEYICRPGFQNIGEKKDICLDSERWSSVAGPKCIDIDECYVGHGCDIKANCHNTEGSYHCKCNPGFMGNGKRCQVITCDNPATFKGGTFTSLTTNSYKVHYPASRLKFECNDDHYLIGTNVSTCLSSGVWTQFPTCLEKSHCIKDTYRCQLNRTRMLPHLSAYCTCKFVTFQEEKPLNKWINTLVIALTVLCGFITLLVVCVFLFIKIRRKEKKKSLKRGAIERTSRIYADIKEIELDFKLDEKSESKSSKRSTKSELTASLPPNLPPRRSISSCGSLEQNSLFLCNRNNPLLRRKSDIICSDSSSLNPRLSPENAKKKFGRIPCNISAKAQTQFKLSSITNAQRRNSEFTRCSTFGFPSNIMIPQIHHSTETIEETYGESDINCESPYIDVTGDEKSSDSESDSGEKNVSEHSDGSFNDSKYTPSTKFNREVEVEYECDNKRNVYQKAACKHFHRSLSLPDITEHFHQSIDVRFSSSNGSGVKNCPDVLDCEERFPRKHPEKFCRSKRKRFSFNFKFKSVSKKQKGTVFDDNTPEISRRISRYKVDVNHNRERSDTNPY